MTGGGFLNGKRHFTIGVRDGDLDWGHFMYSSKAAGLTGVKPFLLASVYDAAVPDRGEPGRSDTFELVLGGELIAAGLLEGGNVQAHRPCETR